MNASIGVSLRKELSLICKLYLDCCFQTTQVDEDYSTELAQADETELYSARSKKRCRTSNHVRIVSEEAINNYLQRGTEGGVESVARVSLLQHYAKTLMEHGDFIWRFTPDNCDIILINDVNETNGEFSYSAFCHVTAT